MEKKYKNIFSIRVAKRLIELGEVVVRIAPNWHNPSMTVYTFKIGPNFAEHMSIATQRKEKQPSA